MNYQPDLTRPKASPELVDAIDKILPNYWNAFYKIEFGHPIVTECDEPTFWIYADGAEWVRPVAELKAEFAKDDAEMADEWEREAVELFGILNSAIANI